MDMGSFSFLQQLPVKMVVGFDRVAPEEACAHGATAHRIEQLPVLEDGQRAFHRLAVARDRWFIEEKTGDAIVNAVGQTAGTARYGQRGVALCVHLAQPTWLVTRGHEQEIAAGKQPTGFGFVEADAGCNLSGIAPGKLTQLLFYGSFTATEDCQLTAGFNDGLGNPYGQVQALLTNQP